MKQHTKKGFSLIEMSVVLTIISVVIAGVLPGLTSLNKSRELEVTNARMKAIEDALLAFRLVNDRLPCPASFTINEGTTNFGVEGATPGTCTGGTPAANWTSGDGRGGALPVRSLNLPDEYAYDGWGRKFAYHVDVRLTAASAFTNNDPISYTGIYTVRDASGAARTPVGAAYALWSAGPDGHGAFTANGVRFNRSITNTDAHINCSCSAAAAFTAYTTTLVQRARYTDPTNSVNQFDDIVSYKMRSQIETSTVYGSDLWSSSGISNLFPTATASGMGVSVGQAINTQTLNTNTYTPKLLVAQPAAQPGILSFVDDNNLVSLNTGPANSNIYALYAYRNNIASARGIMAEVGNTASGNSIALSASNTAQTGAPTGLFVDANVTASSNAKGIANALSGTSGSAAYGIYNTTSIDTSAGNLIGMYNTVSGASGSAVYGIANSITGSPASNLVGIQSIVGVSGTPVTVPGNAYNMYSVSYTNAAGTNYGLYSILHDGSAGTSGYGIYGRVYGTTNLSVAGYGVYGEMSAANGGAAGARYGVYGTSSVASSYGVYATRTGSGPTAFRGYYSASYLCDIGTASYSMDCTGNARITGNLTITGSGTVGGVAISSDKRLKKDVTDSVYGLDEILKLRAVDYNWHDASKNRKGIKDIGFLAQDVEEIMPTLVHEFTLENDKTTYKSLDYTKLTAPLVKAVQQLHGFYAKLAEALGELRDTVAALAARLDTHDKEIKALKAENAELKSRLDAIERKLDTAPAKH